MSSWDVTIRTSFRIALLCSCLVGNARFRTRLDRFIICCLSLDASCKGPTDDRNSIFKMRGRIPSKSVKLLRKSVKLRLLRGLAGPCCKNRQFTCFPLCGRPRGSGEIFRDPGNSRPSQGPTWQMIQSRIVVHWISVEHHFW